MRLDVAEALARGRKNAMTTISKEIERGGGRSDQPTVTRHGDRTNYHIGSMDQLYSFLQANGAKESNGAVGF